MAETIDLRLGLRTPQVSAFDNHLWVTDGLANLSGDQLAHLIDSGGTNSIGLLAVLLGPPDITH